MGGEVIRFDPRRAKQELGLIKQQNDLLENSNRLLSRELWNGMSGVLQAAGQFNITSFNPLFQANIAAPITLNYTFLNYFYKTHGIIQTAINQPVLDALRGGVDLHSDEMDEEDIEDLLNFMDEEDILYGVVGNAQNWARLFGGGAIIINDGAADFSSPLQEDAPLRVLKLYPASRWELGSPHKLKDGKAVVDNDNPWQNTAAMDSEYYSYYGKKLHKSRVITLCGKEAPWMLRWQLQGWGMSEVERMVEDFNLYIRTRNVLYDLLNEAKVDVFGIQGLRDTLVTEGGEQRILRRVQTVQQAKNMNNALLMDKEDLYEQKQITFTGIAEVMKENKMAIASALRMPISKIFGISATGFSSGEDDIENYNAMVESEVRQHLVKPIRKVIDLCQRFIWGQVFTYKMKFKPLRVMSAKDEEDIREKKFNRLVQLYDRGLMDSEEVGQALHKDTLVSVETKAQKGQLEEFPAGPAGMQAELDQETMQAKPQPKASKGESK